MKIDSGTHMRIQTVGKEAVKILDTICDWFNVMKTYAVVRLMPSVAM